MIRTSLIDSVPTGTQTHDSDLSQMLLAYTCGGIMCGMSASMSALWVVTIGIGNAFVPVTRSGKKFAVYVENTANESITLAIGEKAWIEINPANIANPALNTSVVGAGIATLNKGTSYPATNYTPLGERTNIGFVDQRQIIRKNEKAVDTITLDGTVNTSTLDLPRLCGNVIPLTGTGSLTNLGIHWKDGEEFTFVNISTSNTQTIVAGATIKTPSGNNLIINPRESAKVVYKWWVWYVLAEPNYTTAELNDIITGIVTPLIVNKYPSLSWTMAIATCNYPSSIDVYTTTLFSASYMEVRTKIIRQWSPFSPNCNVYVQYSPDNVNWTIVYEITWTPYGTMQLSPTFTLPPWYVRIRMNPYNTANTWFVISEISVYPYI